MAARPRSERGSASVLAVSLLMVVVFVTAGVAVVGGIFAAHRQAQAAADLAALAGAVAVRDGGDPCAQAASIAAANDGELIGCVVVRQEVTVDVSVEGPSHAGRFFAPTATAKAGPG